MVIAAKFGRAAHAAALLLGWAFFFDALAAAEECHPDPFHMQDCIRFAGAQTDSRLPDLKPNRVSFGLGPCSEACELSADDAVSVLRLYPSIQEVELMGWPVLPADTTAFVRAAAKLETVRHIHLIDMRLDEEVLSCLSELDGLRRLTIGGRTVRGDGKGSHMPAADETWIYRAIAKSKRLESLSISRHTRIGGEGLSHLASVRTLSHLRLEASELDDSNVSELAEISALRELELPNADLSPAGIRQLASLPHLSKLTLRGLTPEKIEALTTLSQLTDLTVVADPQTAGVDALTKLPRLQNLKIVADQR